MTGEHGDVALLIDWENLKWSLQKAYQAAPNISSLVEATREYGRLVLARAYAPWTNPLLAGDAQILYRAGIEPVYVPAHKNSADVRIAVDAADLCRQLEHVRTVVLVTGDYDLIHVLNYLRLNGRRAVVVGVGSAMAGLLAPAADAVLLYEQDIEPLAPSAVPPAPRAPDATPSAVPFDTVIGWIERILRERSGGHPYSLNRIGQDLRDRHQFSARQNHGVSLKGLMQRAGSRFHFTTDGATDYASLTPPPAPSLDPVAGDAAADAASAPPQPVPRVNPFDVLVPTVRKVRQQQALAYFPAVQQALEERIGVRLRDIGYKRLTDFFREAEQQGLIQIMHLPNGAHILLWPGEAPPGDAPVAVQVEPPGDAPVVVQAAQRVIFEQLDNEARRALVRIIAAVEDRAREQGGQVAPGSLRLHIRHSLPLNGGPLLSNGQVDRLLKTELVELRRVTEAVTEVRHPETGERREIQTYTLRRDHPIVAKVLAAGQAVLSPAVEIRLLTLADAPSAPPAGDAPQAS